MLKLFSRVNYFYRNGYVTVYKCVGCYLIIVLFVILLNNYIMFYMRMTHGETFQIKEKCFKEMLCCIKLIFP